MTLARLSSTLLLATLLATLATVQAQSSTPTSLAPAAQTVPPSSAAGAPLFATERVQLTQPVIDNLTTTLNESTAALFAFGNNTANSTLAARSFGGCKVFPGDTFWPSELIWKIFNLLSGGALIKTVPSASPCYQGWGDFNSAECSAIAAQWNNSHFQYVSHKHDLRLIDADSSAPPTQPPSCGRCTKAVPVCPATSPSPATAHSEAIPATR